MAQSLAKNVVHIVFGTKRRRRLLKPPLRPRLHAYMAAILNDLRCPALKINSVWDHVHVLVNLHRNCALADVVMELKRGSSGWLSRQGGELSMFQWQGGYGAFSVSQSGVATVVRYIERQEQHHGEISFEDEFRTLLQAHDLEFDERFLWD